MSHKKFTNTLALCYDGITTDTETIRAKRIDFILHNFRKEKDFRYVVQLFCLEDFNFNTFISKINDLNEIHALKVLYIQIKELALRIRKSMNTHRCKVPKIKLDHFTKDFGDLEVLANLTVNDYKMNSDFFYEHDPRLNSFGPIAHEIKSIISENIQQKKWSDVPMLERKLKGSLYALEYTFFEGSFPVEGKLVKQHTLNNGMYLTSTTAQLLSALKQRNIKLLGCHIAQYENLSLTIKKDYMTLIRQNKYFIEKYTAKKDRPSLRAWSEANYEYTTKA